MIEGDNNNNNNNNNNNPEKIKKPMEVEGDMEEYLTLDQAFRILFNNNFSLDNVDKALKKKMLTSFSTRGKRILNQNLNVTKSNKHVTALPREIALRVATAVYNSYMLNRQINQNREQIEQMRLQIQQLEQNNNQILENGNLAKDMMTIKFSIWKNLNIILFFLDFF